MKEKQLEILKENLERRFGFLIKNTNYEGLYKSETEYLYYLFSEEISSIIIENLIKKFKLNHHEKMFIADYYYNYIWYKIASLKTVEEVTSNKFDWKEILIKCIPPFYNQYIDSQLHLQGKLYFFLKNKLGLIIINDGYSLPTKSECEEIKHIFDKKFTNNLTKIRKYSKDTKIIDNSDIEISRFSCFHSSLIEEINDLLKKEIKSVENKNIIDIKNDGHIYILMILFLA